MPFSPKAWQNSPSTTTPINAAALIDMETRLSAYSDTLGGLTANGIAKTADFNVDNADRGGEYDVTSSSAVVVTIRAVAVHAVTTNAIFFVNRLGTGGVSFVHALGSSNILSPYGYTTLNRQYSGARLRYLGSDQWLLQGDLA